MVLPKDIFDPILTNDLYDSSVSFTVYLLNPKITSNIKYSYAVTNMSCHSSLLLHYSSSYQYMLIDLSSTSSSYGSFIPNVGFQLISYPRLFLQVEDKRVMNPSFIPEIAQVLHEAVTMYLYPDIQHGLFSIISENPERVLDDGPVWDFGVVRVEILTVVEEVKGDNYENFVSMNKRDLESFWKRIEKQVKQISVTNKRIEFNIRFFPLAQVPNFSLILTESYELLSTNHTAQRNDMYTHIRSDVLFSLLHEHESEIWEEFGLTQIEKTVSETTVGGVTILPVYM